ncbi:MAG: hypothetical protein H7A52_10815 [Akkermansiaceae bacterium]|nr:hypothetical protein [Akkermansiaceae bacterium]
MKKSTSPLAAFVFLAACSLFVAAPSALSQTTPGTGGGGTGTGGQSGSGGASEEDGINGFWEVVLPTGRFVVQLNHISSVSQHTYIIDGSARVFEVTVDTTGPMTARFYYIEPVTDGSPLSLGKNTIDRLREVAGEVSSRTGGPDMETDVIKHYPDTTHAKTAEYRLQVKENLDRIYEHLHRVWAEEKGRGQKNKLTIRNE